MYPELAYPAFQDRPGGEREESGTLWPQLVVQLPVKAATSTLNAQQQREPEHGTPFLFQLACVVFATTTVDLLFETFSA